jgi:hypothetical protein
MSPVLELGLATTFENWPCLCEYLCGKDKIRPDAFDNGGPSSPIPAGEVVFLSGASKLVVADPVHFAHYFPRFLETVR